MAPGESGPNVNESMFSIVPCFLFFALVLSSRRLSFPSCRRCGRRAGKTDGEAKDDRQTEGGGRGAEHVPDRSGETICGLLATGKVGDQARAENTGRPCGLFRHFPGCRGALQRSGVPGGRLGSVRRIAH